MRSPLSRLVVLAGLILLPATVLMAQSNPPAAPVPPSVPQATISVDCDAGESLADALATRADELTVEFTGTCSENLVIERDRVTLRGVGSARLEGAAGVNRPTLLARGSSPLRLETFEAANAETSTLVLTGGSSAVVESLEVVESGNRCLSLDLGSSAEIVESSFRNGSFGIVVDGGSFAKLTGPTQVRDQQAAGVLLSHGSDLRSDLADRLRMENTGIAGLAVQLHGFAKVYYLEVVGSTIGVFVDTEARYLGQVLMIEDAQIGAFLDYQAAIDTVGTIDASAIGVVAGNQSSFAIGSSQVDTSVITGQVSLDNSVGNFVNSSVEDTAVLSFGTRASFFDSTVGTLICDDTVLVRGSVSCPPAASLQGAVEGLGLDVEDIRRKLFGAP